MTSEITELIKELFVSLEHIRSDLDAERFDRVLSSADAALLLCARATSDWEGVVSAAEGSIAANAFVAARRSGDIKRSLTYAQREYAVAERSGGPAVRVRALNNRGLAYHELNQLVAAEADYRAALRLVDENPAEDLASMKSLLLSHLGQLLSTRGQTDEAMPLLLRAGTIKGSGSPFVQFFDPELSRDNDLAMAAATVGEHKKAETILRDAIARSAGHSAQIEGILVCNLAEVLHQSGQREEAIEIYQRAIELHRRDPGSLIELATDYVNLAGIYMETGNRDRTVECYKSAWDTARKNNPRSLVALKALWGLAINRMVQKDYERARAAIFRGLDLYEEMRPDIAITESGQSGFLDAYRSLLEVGMYLALVGSWPDELRSLIERGKARFALERLARTAERLPGEQRHADFDDVGINGLALDFFVGPNATFISYQYNRSLGGARVDVRETEMAAMVDEFREELLSSSRRAREGVAAARLSRLLFEKLRIEFSGVRYIYWLPDGPLWYAPLEALPVEKSAGASDQMTLGSVAPASYVPSISVLAALRTGATEAPSRDEWHVLAFGEPCNDDAFPPLAGTAKELDHLHQLSDGRFKITIRRGAEATRENFLALAPFATHIHIAAHAVADFHSEQPYIVFSGHGEQQFLHTGELAAMKLKANVVFLSACSTSVGRKSTGEGVMSLARAFLWSGCRCVVASLWPMPDTAVPLIVESFYSGLVAGLSPAQAAQQAREQHRLRGGTPKSWAGFQVLGDGDTWSERYSLKYFKTETL